MMTAITANTGKKIARNDMNAALTVSQIEKIGLATPPVVAVETARPPAFTPLITAAAPPPPMMAKAQVTAGFKSAMVDAITAVPATPAKGTAKVSSKLSNQGIKYAKASAIQAAAKIIKAKGEASHCHCSFSGHTLK